MKIRWWPHTRKQHVASVRLRCYRVMRELRSLGMDVRLYSPWIDRPDVIVMAKRYDPESVLHAERLRKKCGTRLILDLCDNHFYTESDASIWAERERNLVRAVLSVDLVVTASAALADVVRQKCPGQKNIVVIGDMVESAGTLATPFGLCDIMAGLRLRQLVRFLDDCGVSYARRLVWYGSHGSPGVSGGLSDVQRIQHYLEAANAHEPITLTIVSNNYQKYELIRRELAVPTFYIPWNSVNFSQVLLLHSIAVIPIARNPFTECKTNNRLSTALMHNLNVVADLIPSYSEFSGCCVLDDWSYGLGGYLGDVDKRSYDVESGLLLLQQAYGPGAIAAKWREVLSDQRNGRSLNEKMREDERL